MNSFYENIEVRKVITYWGMLTGRSTKELFRMIDMLLNCCLKQ